MIIMHRRTWLLLTVVLLCLPLTACAFSGDAIEGKVLEEGTNKPVASAIVVVRWEGDLAGFAESRHVCVHVDTATSDNQGHYRFAGWSKESTIGWVRDLHPIVTAYKVGYVLADHYPMNNPLLKSFTGERGERLEYLDKVISSTSCGDKDSRKNLYRIYRAVYEEALAIAQTAEEKKHAERLKEIADYVLVNQNKPTTYDERGRTINIDPKDSFRPEDVK